MEPKIKISDYTYILPDERIAKYPLDNRDDSKLLVYKDDIIKESHFNNIDSFIPNDSLMIFNNTKVVPARMLFQKSTGAIIEIFCLEPTLPSDYAISFSATSFCEWSVVIGNSKKWKGGDIGLYVCGANDNLKQLNLRAELVSRSDNESIVKFKWDNCLSFSQVLDLCGNIPIPPYLKRDTEKVDLERYQTLYAKIKGSVAAPTAGLHFTEGVFAKIDNMNVKRDSICLHVGAGTFLPVKSEYISGHKMHTEPFEITIELLSNIINTINNRGKIIAVGTTSARCLESLYYLGVNYIENSEIDIVNQWDPYVKEYNYSLKEVVIALYDYMKNSNISRLNARTSIIIVPSFKFRVVDILITNFHQPQSTLLLLISAFTNQNWHKIYDHALSNDFRFLSYGDSSILFR